jgi:hypothetical protein
MFEPQAILRRSGTTASRRRYGAAGSVTTTARPAARVGQKTDHAGREPIPPTEQDGWLAHVA